MSKNIINNITLESYNKKYRNCRTHLIRLNKTDVEEFDKKYNVKNGYLLRHYKWALIGDTYYEIPKPIRFTWFRNLNAGVQIATCLLGAGIVATAAVVPTVLLTNNKIEEKVIVNEVELEVEGVKSKELYIKSRKILSNGDFQIVIKEKEVSSNALTVYIDKITIGNQKLIETEDCTISNTVVTIKKKVIEEHKNQKIIITFKEGDIFDPTRDIKSDNKMADFCFIKKEGDNYIYDLNVNHAYDTQYELLDIKYIKVGDHTLSNDEYTTTKNYDYIIKINKSIFEKYQGTIAVDVSVQIKGLTYIINPSEPITMQSWIADQFRIGPSPEASWSMPTNIKPWYEIEIHFTDVAGGIIKVMSSKWNPVWYQSESISSDEPFKFEFTEEMYNTCIKNKEDLVIMLTQGSAKLSKMFFHKKIN